MEIDNTCDICLINMPYASLERPSLALGLLDTYISAMGYQVQCLYANLEFATITGVDQYYRIESAKNADLIGEWTFAQAAFAEHHFDIDAFAASLGYLTEQSCQHLLKVRQFAQDYINNLARDIVNANPKIVGCTSTFQQNTASLALLRKIKTLQPNIITMMGGANCEGCMGQTISDTFDWVDYIFSGESDEVIGEFIQQLMQGHHFGAHNLPAGVISHQHKRLISDVNDNSNNAIDKQTQQQVSTPRAVVDDMKNVGKPNYDSYFNTLASLKFESEINPGLIVETSRGCWWGAKRHCTFCGLNGHGMTHRAKDASTVLNEFQQLSSRYDNNKFEVVDNILPMEYMDSLMIDLVDESYSIFYETKANLSKQHVETLAKAGVRWIQPGIESLQDDFLRLVKKGTTAVQNIAALKWCRQSNIRVAWNLLFNAPGEQQAWYHQMAEYLPLLVHLQPPQPQMGIIGYPRFSPYVNEPQDYGLVLQPCPSYAHIYPMLNQQQLSDIAYFFQDHSENNRENPDSSRQDEAHLSGHCATQQALNQWHQQFWCQSSQPLLCMFDQGEQIKILDTREVGTKLRHQLGGLSAHIYRLCEKPMSAERVCKNLIKNQQGLTESDIKPVLEQLVNDKLIIYVSHCYLSLALQGTITPLPDIEDYPGGFLSLNQDTNGWKRMDI